MKQIEVVAGIILENGRVFAAQRNDRGETAYKWEFPGGKIEVGETHSQALERELREELGIETKTGPWVLTVEHQYRDFHLTMHCYLSMILSGEPVLHEHLAACWLGPGDLQGLDWAPADIPVLDRVAEILDQDGSENAVDI